METNLCEQFDLFGSDRAPYTGRPRGSQRKKVQLKKALNRQWDAQSTPKARTWRTFRPPLNRTGSFWGHPTTTALTRGHGCS
eukprot:7540477-Pyramimonas_sp.AAC.1